MRAQREDLAHGRGVVTQALPKPGPRPIRFALQFAALSLVNLTYVPILVLVALLSGGRLARPVIRGWGHAMLWIAGVQLVIEPEARRELARRRRRVVTFNHCSTMDMFLMTALWPPRGAAVIKKEMLRLPVMGQAMALLDFIPLDRSDRGKASALLSEAAARMRTRELSVIVAPEGTRSMTGELQRFKLGAFHMAAEADAPIVPIVLHGSKQLWPRNQRHCNRGRVTVRVLPEQPSGADDASPEAIRARAEHLHAMYAEALAEMERDVPVLLK